VKNNLKVLIFSAIGALVLGGTILVLHLTQGVSDSPTEDAPTPAELVVSLVDIDPALVWHILVSNQEDSYAIYQDVDSGEYRISEFEDYDVEIPYNQQAFLNAAAAAANISGVLVEEDVKNSEKLEEYGLANYHDENYVTVYYGAENPGDKTDAVFIIGKQTPDFSTVYFRFIDSHDVYAVSLLAMSNFLNNRFHFVERKAFPDYNFDEAPAISAVIERLDWDEPLVIEHIPQVALEEIRTFNTHKLTSPISVEIDQEKSRYVLFGIFGLNAKDVMAVAPDDELLETAGLNEPRCVVAVTAGGETYTLTIGRQVLNDQKDAVGWFAMSCQVPDILFLFDELSLPWLFTSPARLVAESFLMPYIFSLDSFGIELPDKDLTLDFKITGDADDSIVFLDGTPLPEARREAFGLLYQFAISARGEELFIDDEPSGENDKPSDSDLVARITYSYRDSSRGSEVVEFYAAGSRQSIIRINGRNVFKCRERYTIRLVQNVEAFLADEPIKIDW
jgi:hypothetical protein